VEPAAWIARAPARAVAGDLKAVQAQVNEALAVRKKRYDAWQKASQQRDKATAEVDKLKRARAPKDQLEAALARALKHDDQTARARSQLLAAEADLSKGGAELLRLYDALLVERRTKVEALPVGGPERQSAAGAYQQLVAQRDAVRRALLPVLQDEAPVQAPSDDTDLEPNAGDDTEALLEKADIARDREDRAYTQILAVRRRISELNEAAAVERGMTNMLRSSAMNDEESRVLKVTRQDLATANPSNLGGGARESKSPEAPPAPTDADVTFGSATAVVAPPPAPAPFVSTEQGFAGPQTDSSIANMLSSSSVSLDELQALEKRLLTDAQRMKAKSAQLKKEAEARARE
jgi:hypothetical protein